MFKFLLVIILFFLLMAILLGFSFVRGLKNLIFGSSSRQQSYKSTRSQKQYQQKAQKEEAKIVRKLMEDAEYVDYEEVKD
ncbi:MAG: DUF4834 family protein [Dysgonamonadaceae bacterium]|nr:DUF4834 family protein [Dysgonamonadaceae bacterium]